MLLDPPERDVLIELADRRGAAVFAINRLAWAVGLIAQGGRCAVEGCELVPTALDHDHGDKGGTGYVRGLVCPQHNNGWTARSGPLDDAALAQIETWSNPAMLAHLAAPPLGSLGWTYVNANGYADGCRLV